MSGARQGRRRRILQEEVLSASREATTYSPGEDPKTDGGEGRRYAFDEGSLGGALAKRHFPNQLIVPIGLLVASVAVIGGTTVLHHYHDAVAAVVGERAASLLDATSSASIATWTASASMILVAMMAAMVFAVRRRRVDDYRGRHRLWRGAVIAAAFLSLDAATDLHSIIAEAASHAVGGQLLAGGAEWWIVGGMLALGYIGVRVVLDIKESRLAFAIFLLAAIAGGVAVVGPLFGVGGELAPWIARVAQLSSYLMATVSIVAYMRFLRQDVAAGVATKPQKSRTAEVRIAKQTVQAESGATASAKLGQADEDDSTKSSRRKTQRSKATSPETAATESQWTDGSDGYNDDYEEGGQPRKLSKSERKRMRQMKASRRAA